MKPKFPIFLLTLGAALCLANSESIAQELTCGLKQVTIENGKIARIRHEDGTVHEGAERLSRYWSYDGKSIRHSLLAKELPCSSSAPSRAQIVEDLSSKYRKKPSRHNMSSVEGELMAVYTKRLMENSRHCHSVIDAAKSTSRAGMFFIDCNDVDAKRSRIWLSRSELENLK